MDRSAPLDLEAFLLMLWDIQIILKINESGTKQVFKNIGCRDGKSTTIAFYVGNLSISGRNCWGNGCALRHSFATLSSIRNPKFHNPHLSSVLCAAQYFLSRYFVMNFRYLVPQFLNPSIPNHRPKPSGHRLADTPVIRNFKIDWKGAQKTKHWGTFERSLESKWHSASFTLHFFVL